MYVPSQFEESRIDVMHHLMRGHPLGTLVTLGSDGLNANHVPFEIDPERGSSGTLVAHVARANPVWRDCDPNMESLAIFQGAQIYISPSLYATKQETGKVVPTYNYMVVHAYGHIRAIEDPDWMRAFLTRLTDRYESGRQQPWKLTDAPADYIEKLLPAIVGIEMQITRLVGKWKVSQNQPAVNRVSVEQGLRAAGDSNAIAMAEVLAKIEHRK